MHGCTQLGYAITQAANANRPHGGPLPGSFTGTKCGWVGQGLETHGPCWAGAGSALIDPQIINWVHCKQI